MFSTPGYVLSTYAALVRPALAALVVVLVINANAGFLIASWGPDFIRAVSTFVLACGVFNSITTVIIWKIQLRQQTAVAEADNGLETLPQSAPVFAPGVAPLEMALQRLSRARMSLHEGPGPTAAYDFLLGLTACAAVATSWITPAESIYGGALSTTITGTVIMAFARLCVENSAGMAQASTLLQIDKAIKLERVAKAAGIYLPMVDASRAFRRFGKNYLVDYIHGAGAQIEAAASSAGHVKGD